MFLSLFKIVLFLTVVRYSSSDENSSADTLYFDDFDISYENEMDPNYEHGTDSTENKQLIADPIEYTTEDPRIEYEKNKRLMRAEFIQQQQDEFKLIDEMDRRVQETVEEIARSTSRIYSSPTVGSMYNSNKTSATPEINFIIQIILGSLLSVSLVIIFVQAVKIRKLKKLGHYKSIANLEIGKKVIE